MEDISLNLDDDFYSYYTSAPTSPRKCNNLDGYFFLSMPTSPTRNPPGFESGSITPVTHENVSPYVNSFEFEGSKRFCSYENEVEKSQNQSMAYANELFYHGKMLPLRLPPQARYTRPKKGRGSDSTASSPGARNSKLKVPFLKQRSLWNDGFDPFIAALNKVKDENDVVGSHGKKAQLRRSKSLSSFTRPNGPANTHMHNKISSSLSPERDVFGSSKRNILEPIQEPKENIAKSQSLQSRKQRIKKFLFKNATFGKEVNVQKKEHKTPLLLKKMHNYQKFGITNSNTIIRISREMKSLMKHRARVLFCLATGFTVKGTKT